MRTVYDLIGIEAVLLFTATIIFIISSFSFVYLYPIYLSITNNLSNNTIDNVVLMSLYIVGAALFWAAFTACAMNLVYIDYKITMSKWRNK